MNWSKIFIILRLMKRKIWEFIKQNWWNLFFSCLAVVFCCLYVDDIDGFLVEKLKCLGLNLNSIYDNINGNYILNVILTLGTVVGIFQLWRQRCKDRCFSFFKTTVAISFIILLLKQTKWDVVSTAIPLVDYGCLISLAALGYLLFMVVGLAKRRIKKEMPQTKLLTLYADIEGEVGISESRQKYAAQLAERLLNTDVKKEAYAVGIAGEWGSGKTLFLKEVKRALGNRAIIVDFNPWNSKDEKHLAKDFLRTLAKSLSPMYSGILSPISKYASLLYSLRIHVTSDYLLQYLPKHEEKDLTERKADIETALDKVGKRVAVFIDDIDRLEGKEIFEVLRIIRNTAVFRHVMYVVAYDKDHVVNQLSRLDIGNGGDYLEKIFQMEVLIPKSDERMMVEEFRTVCRAMAMPVSRINSLLDKLSEEDYHMIMKELTSYRKVKRFARQFAFNANYMMNSLTDSNFELCDLLFLNLLESNSSENYKNLWLHPEDVLTVKEHPNNNAKYYSWRKDQNEKQESLYEMLMARLFGDVPDVKSQSIQYVDSFYKYFYLAQPERELSVEEFNNMLGKPITHVAHDGMMTTIMSWVASKENKSCSSIYRAFVNHDTIRQKDYQKCANYIFAIFYWLQLEEREYEHLKELLPQILNKSRFQDGMRKSIMDLVNSKVKYFGEKEIYRTVAIVLSELYGRLDAGEKLRVDINVVESALKKNIELFIKSKPWDPICLFRNDGNMMRKVIEACCVPLKSKMNNRVNLVINQVIDYYSEPGHQSNSYKEAGELLVKVPYLIVPGGMYDLRSVFGDDTKLAEQMLKTCFKGV